MYWYEVTLQQIKKLKSKLSQSDKRQQNTDLMGLKAIMKVNELANQIICKNDEKRYEIQSYKDEVVKIIDSCKERFSLKTKMYK